MKIRSALCAVAALGTVLSLTMIPSEAFAKKKKQAEAAEEPEPAKKKSVALTAISGKKSPEVRGWLRDALAPDFDFTDAEDFRIKGDDESVVKLAHDLGVEFVLVGKLQKDRLVLSIRSGIDGARVGEISIKGTGPKLKRVIEKRLAPNLAQAMGLPKKESAAEKAARLKKEKEDAEEAGAVEEGDEGEGEGEGEEGGEEGGEAGGEEEEEKADEGGEEEEGTGSEDSEEKPAKPDRDKPSVPTGTPFELRGGLRFFQRNFRFNGTLSQVFPTRPIPEANALKDFTGGINIGLQLRGELYPAILFGGSGFVSDLGIVFGYELGLPATTKYKPNDPDPTQRRELKSDAQEWFVGARVRVPVLPTFTMGGVGSYGQHKYILKGDETNPLVPDVKYTYIRIGADARVLLGKLAAEVRLGVRLVLDTGELERMLVINGRPEPLWFEHVGGRGFDGALTLSYSVHPMFAPMVGMEYIRYGFDFNPLASEARLVAGGATEQQLGGFVGVIFQLPGSGTKSDSERSKD